MIAQDAPPPTDPPAPSGPTTLVLPRPNPGPEPWSEPTPGWASTGLVGALLLASVAGSLAFRKWHRHRQRVAAAGGSTGSGTVPDADLRPGERLIASSQAVRAALIAGFGPVWGSRTTEEVARDPDLAARLGLEAARTLVAYLERVDRAKFAGDEPEDVDSWIGAVPGLLAELARPVVRRP